MVVGHELQMFIQERNNYYLFMCECGHEDEAQTLYEAITQREDHIVSVVTTDRIQQLEAAEREQGNAIGAYFEQCGITLDRAIKETEYPPTKPEVEAKQPSTPTPTPVQPRKRHHYDPNGWYF